MKKVADVIGVDEDDRMSQVVLRLIHEFPHAPVVTVATIVIQEYASLSGLSLQLAGDIAESLARAQLNHQTQAG